MGRRQIVPNEIIVHSSKENIQSITGANTASPHAKADVPTSLQPSAREFTEEGDSARDAIITASVGEHDINSSIVEDVPSVPAHFRQLEAAVFAQEKSELRASVEEDTLRKTLIREAFAGARLLTADCRVTLCRVEIVFSDQDGMRRFLDEFPSAVGWNSQGSINMLPPDSSGNSRLVYVLSKDGETLPSL